jgi:hypothetical protein
VILKADDLDCAADGRWLREVSITAGSASLSVPPGSVLAVDVGASISVPGAADMVATIADMPDAKNVERATTTAVAHDLVVHLEAQSFAEISPETSMWSTSAPEVPLAFDCVRNP